MEVLLLINDEIETKLRMSKKADLHIHLNGAVPTDTIKELVRKYNITIPDTFDITKDLQVLSPVQNLLEYFTPWAVFKKMPIGFVCLVEMVRSTFKQLVEDNVSYVELRNSPFYISRLNNISLDEALIWLIDAINLGSEEFGLQAKLILSITRHEFNIDQAKHLLRAIKNVNAKGTIVGIDMSGNEDHPVSFEVSKVFRLAKEELGLNITIHAGETGSIDNIEWAINECRADRIGHGSAAMKSENLMELICEKNICIEVSLTSNLRSGYCNDIKNHAVKTFIDKGVPFVLCTDNPSVHGANLSDEYLLFLKTFNREDIIQEMYKRQMLYAFGGEYDSKN